MSDNVTIVDTGRGPQLSNKKITVQDLLPMFTDGSTDESIFRWYPMVTPAELALLRQYYLDHTEEVLALERQIAVQAAELRKRYPGIRTEYDGMPLEEKLARWRERLAARKVGANGAHPHP